MHNSKYSNDFHFVDVANDLVSELHTTHRIGLREGREVPNQYQRALGYRRTRKWSRIVSKERHVMMRITMEEKADFTEFRLEGKLTGDWVKEFKRCWVCAKHTGPGTRFKIDLSGVSFVDEKGKALLESMVSEGAELLADGPMMRSLAHSIVENAISDLGYKDRAEDDLPSNLLLGE